MSSSVARAGHSNWLIGGLASLSIAALVLATLSGIEQGHKTNDTVSKLQGVVATVQDQNAALRAQQTQTRRDERCNARYQHESAQRTAAVNAYAAARSRALGRAQLYQARHPQANGRYLVRLRLAYVAADRAYLRANARNPTPKYPCADLPPVKVPSIGNTLPPAPHTSPSTPAPRTVTRTVQVPGPVRTVTRTVTRTVCRRPNGKRC